MYFLWVLLLLYSILYYNNNVHKKEQGLNNYIYNIEDLNGNGKYDCADFLDMDNKDILKENNNKKFSFVIQNPPYGSVGGDTLHLRFVDKCLDLADKQIAIFPFNFVQKLNNKSNNKFKEKFSKYLIEVEEVKGEEFKGTHMPNAAIYKFENNKKENNIKIIPLNGEERNIDSLLNTSRFSKYEEEIIKYLDKYNKQLIIGAGRVDKRKKELDKISPDKHKEFLDNKIIENSKLLKKYLENDYNAGLIINQSNGGCNGKALSSKNGQIFTEYKDFENLFLNLRSSSGYNVILFNSKKEAENCKVALQNPLLRFTIYREQDDQNMYPRVYKHITELNWSDDRVKTDEGLLEVCGCPKDKAKEYAEYCKKVIEDIDNKRK